MQAIKPILYRFRSIPKGHVVCCQCLSP